MGSAILQFLLAALVILAAGTLLTRCADVIADRTGLGRLFVGIVFLASATSLPELSVDLAAVRMGAADLGVGDLMGSSLCNLFILGVLDLTHRQRGRMFSRASAAHALSGAVSIGMIGLAATAIVLGRHLATGAAFAGISAPAWVILAVFLLSVRLVYYDQRAAARQLASHPPPLQPSPAAQRSLVWALAGFAVASVAIFFAGPFLARAAQRLADLSGLGTTFVGSTFVAFYTSLPELTSSLAAVRIGAFDLAVGNIFGSNAFNMVLLVPLDAVAHGSLFASVSPNHAITCLAAIVVTCVAIAGQLYRAENRILLLEPDALLVMLLSAGSLALLYFLPP